jgi:hypothetical protein
MSATLFFNDRKYEVVTSSWSVAAKPDANYITVCYSWGADGISWFDSATGVSSCELMLRMEEFVKRISKGGVIDLRDVS